MAIGSDVGGIASLTLIIREHGDALEYDLITRTPHTLRSVPGSLDWRELGAFVKYLPMDSALKSEMNPDSAYWEGSRRVPMMLADLFDLLQFQNYLILKTNGAKPKKPKPYPRPGAKKNAKTYGRGAIPISDFSEWWGDEKG